MNKLSKWKKLEYAAIGFLLLCLVFLSFCFYKPEPAVNAPVSVVSDWYRLQDGQRIEVRLPANLTPGPDGSLTLYCDKLTRSEAGKFFSARGIQYGLEIRMGDSLLYQYRENAFLKNDQMKGKLWADVFLPQTTGSSPLCLVYRNMPDSPQFIYAPIFGPTSAVTRQHLIDHALSFAVLAGMLGIGILSLAIYLYLKYHDFHEPRFLDVALFLFLCSLWSFTDSGIYHVYGKEIAIGSLISFYAFMLMSVPMLHFVQNTVTLKRSPLPGLWIAALYANAFFQGIWYLLTGIPFIHMLFLTHILLFSGVITMILLLRREYLTTHNRGAGLCLIAFAILGVGGIISLILYWLFKIYWYDAIFQFGIMLYILLLFWGLICKITNDIRFRMEQEIREKMSMEDRMTGLKNKKAFEHYLAKLERHSDEYANAFLAFLKLENLKEANAAYGMSAGNELIISAAQCIQNVCRELSPEPIECFRTDGNEFAVILTDPKISFSDYETMLQKEIRRFNASGSSRCQVCLTLGHSYFKDSLGNTQSISSWKSQADYDQHKSSGQTAASQVSNPYKRMSEQEESL